jgi:polyisoprenoid-binding protein YceI
MFKNLLIASVALASVTAFAKTDKVEIDSAASKLTYVGKKVTGQHTGEVKIGSGYLNFEKNALKGGEVVIDMTTITNTDIADQEYHKKFIDHMNSADFFDTANSKTATIVFKNVKKVKGDNYKITGDLTIKGKTAPVTFDAIANKDKANAKVVFDRTKYDIKYGSGKFFENLGDKMINDSVELDVQLAAKK